ncbi:MAG TPA: hypothetical protein VGW35_22865 [Methylomirabilota bacterium]|jgi:hypothetical protein|nr:hypothetical protein [Methylomirabilota bacterium]
MGRSTQRLTRGLRAPVVLAAVLSACAGLAPLREPPLEPSEDPTRGVTTRAEAMARYGPPYEVLASDLGPVLVYRRRIIVDVNPNRYFGQDRGTHYDRYERVLLYLDGQGRIVRWSIETE